MCAQRGYKCVITMAEPFSVERRKLMRMIVAKVIVTPKAGKGTGMVEKAAELAEKHGWFLCHQFETDANWKIHEATTGPEIINDLKKINKKLGDRIRNRWDLSRSQQVHQGQVARYQDRSGRTGSRRPRRFRDSHRAQRGRVPQIIPSGLFRPPRPGMDA